VSLAVASHAESCAHQAIAAPRCVCQALRAACCGPTAGPSAACNALLAQHTSLHAPGSFWLTEAEHSLAHDACRAELSFCRRVVLLRLRSPGSRRRRKTRPSSCATCTLVSADTFALHSCRHLNLNRVCFFQTLRFAHGCCNPPPPALRCQPVQRCSLTPS
jgi:hypothetical protein